MLKIEQKFDYGQKTWCTSYRTSPGYPTTKPDYAQACGVHSFTHITITAKYFVFSKIRYSSKENNCSFVSDKSLKGKRHFV